MRRTPLSQREVEKVSKSVSEFVLTQFIRLGFPLSHSAPNEKDNIVKPIEGQPALVALRRQWPEEVHGDRGEE